MRYLYMVMILLGACQNHSIREQKLQRFQKVLEDYRQTQKSMSEQSTQNLKKQVKKEGNTSEGRERIAEAEKLLKKTDSLQNQIEEIKKKILSTQSADLQKLMLGDKKNGLAYQLKQKLNQYIDYLLKNYRYLGLGISKDYFPYFMDDNSEYPLYKNMNFNGVEVYFKDVDSTFLIININSIQNILNRYAQEVLKKLGASSYDYYSGHSNRITPLAIASSNYVLVGEEYQASLFIAISSSMPGFRLMFNNQALNVNENGIATVKFIAQGQGQQTWQAQLNYYHYQMIKDTTVIINQNYYVFHK